MDGEHLHTSMPPTRIGSGDPVLFVIVEKIFGEKLFGYDLLPGTVSRLRYVTFLNMCIPVWSGNDAVSIPKPRK